MSHEQRLEGSPSRVQRWESTEDDWRSMEAGGVQIDAEKLVDCLQASSISRDGVVGRGQSVRVLVPWWRAREDCLDKNGRDVHVSKCACPGRKSTRRSPDEHAAADDDRRYIVYDSIRQPREQVKKCVFVCRKDVAQVCAIQDVLERGQNADPDRWPVVGGNIPAGLLLANLQTGAELRGGAVLPRDPKRSASSQAPDCGADRSDVLAT
jgi:hypothetical protein